LWRNCGLRKYIIVTKIYLLRDGVYESDNYYDEILFIAKVCYESLQHGVYESDNYYDKILFIAKVCYESLQDGVYESDNYYDRNIIYCE
jgi:hypothetical protein